MKAPVMTDSVYDTTKYRSACSQLALPFGGTQKPKPDVSIQGTETSENCLYLNIHKPMERSVGKSFGGTCLDPWWRVCWRVSYAVFR